ncbi:pre-peptidase C-terminal domain-containing protein [Candidatus Uhrbacteria bacterium]|nr:pre-peptidase C-terminal domain-containing protein [Candidatus Uhrbacteria bacterium]
MDAPYRNDEVAKLLAENEKLREQYDGIMSRYALVKKWPIGVALFLVGAILCISAFEAGNKTARQEAIQTLTHQDRAVIVAQTSDRVSRRISATLREDIQFAVSAELERRQARTVAKQPAGQNRQAQDELRLGQVVRGQIHSRKGYRQQATIDPERGWWRFNARVGDRVVFRMKSTDVNLDPFIQLYAPDGRRVAEDENSGSGTNATLIYAFTSTGQYLIAARCGIYGPKNIWTDVWSGNYTLSARLP